MYKVFYNQKLLDFTSDLNKNTNSTPLFFFKYANSKSIIKALKDKSVSKVYLYHLKPEKFEKHLFKIFSCVDAAGGLVKHKDGSILFIYRNNKWDLPKGKIEKKEILTNAAIREVQEETGVGDLLLKKALPVTYHIYNANGKYKIKKTHWFLMETNFTGQLVPQTEENIQMAVWKANTEIPILMQNAYENIKIVLEEIK